MTTKRISRYTYGSFNNPSQPRNTLTLTVGAIAFSMISVSAGESSHSLQVQPDLAEREGEVLSDWKDRGISPYVTYTGEFFANRNGGFNRGSGWAGLLDLGVELDLEKLGGWKGASLFANAFYFEGNDVSGDYVGSSNVASNIYTDTGFNIYNLFLRQAFGEADSFFKLGQMALDDDFMVSDSALLFLNAGFGPLPIQAANSGAPIYSLAAPGFMVDYQTNTRWFARGGIYWGDAGTASSSNQGFEWHSRDSAGWLMIGEGGIKYGPDDASVVKLGAYYHTGDFDNLTNGKTESGLYSLYGVIDHEVFRTNEGARLNVFLRGGISPQENIATVYSYVDAGMVAHNLFRDDDAVGLAVSLTHFSDDFVLAKGGESSEYVIELTYQFPLSKWLVLQPDIQYIVNPQTSGKDAFLAGLRFEITF